MTPRPERLTRDQRSHCTRAAGRDGLPSWQTTGPRGHTGVPAGREEQPTGLSAVHSSPIGFYVLGSLHLPAAISCCPSDANKQGRGGWAQRAAMWAAAPFLLVLFVLAHEWSHIACYLVCTAILGGQIGAVDASNWLGEPGDCPAGRCVLLRAPLAARRAHVAPCLDRLAIMHDHPGTDELYTCATLPCCRNLPTSSRRPP